MSSASALLSSQTSRKEKPREADSCRSIGTTSSAITDSVNLRQSDPRDATIYTPTSSLSEHRDRMAMFKREYKFFVTTEEPHQPEGEDRGLIRRLVMRNFFEAKEAGPQNSASERVSANTVMAKKQLKSRFRLAKSEQMEPDPKNKIRDDGTKSATGKRKRPRVSRTLSARTIDSETTNDGTNVVDRRNELRSDEERSGITQDNGKHRDQETVFKINPSAHRFDPFDVLPVPGTPQLDILFKLYKSASKKNSIAVNASNTWWSFISNDAGLLHATLATWALYGMLVRDLSELRVDKLRHKNEAINHINLKIDSPGGAITDELVGTVLTMASFENLLGAYSSAQLHVAALQRMVAARGGLFAFGHNDGLIRGIIWVDIHTATAFRTSPSFPQISLDPDTPPLPDALLEEAALTSPTSLLQLSLAGIDLFNVFYRLHRLGLACSSHWIDKVDRLTLSNLLYETEYIILSVPDYSRMYLDFDLSPGNSHEDNYNPSERAANTASVVEALLAATQIFVFAALRDVPPCAKIFGILLERVRVALARSSVSTIRVWKQERQLSMLLWVFVVGWSVAPRGDGRAWWVRQEVDVMAELDVKTRFELEVVLRGVAWADGWFGGAVGGMWEEIVAQRQERGMEEVLLRPVGAQTSESRIWGTRSEEHVALSMSVTMAEGGRTVHGSHA